MTDEAPPKFKAYYDTHLARRFAAQIQPLYPPFAAESFIAQVEKEVESLELKARVALIGQALRDHLPAEYPAALEILLAILPPELPAEDGMFNEGFHLMPIAYFIEAYGLDHFEASVRGMYEVTKVHTAEFTIRPFLRRYTERMLAIVLEWTQDPSPHVRRLCSEGTRPRLPWGGHLTQFIENPRPVLPILAALKTDESGYVRKSVANHWNDISKDHPALVIETLGEWHRSGDERTQWIVRHALRSLIKKGDGQALGILGYGAGATVNLRELTLTPPEAHFPTDLTLSFTLDNPTDEAQNLVIDYVVQFVKANGSRSPKVFKLKTATLSPHESLVIQKKISLRPITTRVYYGGLHRVEVQVNGAILGGLDFELVMPHR